MRAGTPLEWAQLLGVGPDDLPGQTRKLVQGIDVLDEAILQLRMILHGCPDRELSEALLQLERRVREVSALIRELHREVLRELT
jgi:glycogen synthase